MDSNSVNIYSDNEKDKGEEREEDKEESFANYSISSNYTNDGNTRVMPFKLIPGEIGLRGGELYGGKMALSNYRVYIQDKESRGIVPLGVIETVECKDLTLSILCRDAKIFRSKLPSQQLCTDWSKAILDQLTRPTRVHNVFAAAFYRGCAQNNCFLFETLEWDKQAYDDIFEAEMERLSFDLHGVWRVTNANDDYNLCPTYPRKLIVPSSMTDDTLEEVARYRMSRRIPTIVWRHSNGAVIARCSQPEVGWLGWRSGHDESLVKAIAEACSFSNEASHKPSERQRTVSDSTSEPMCDLSDVTTHTKQVTIIDCRSYGTALANRARGGGVECHEYYPTCEISFMDLPNIHIIRKAHATIRSLIAASVEPWLTNLDNTKWLSYISGIIKSSVVVCDIVSKEGRPVLVHCSDGWDRTPQVTSLAQLLMDPYYRTIAGFQVLVEKEWVEFGHKFRDRCGTGFNSANHSDVNERSPIFFQWLECVHQVMMQAPTAFQFNETFLIKIAQHIYSNLFSNFLFNNSKERREAEVDNMMFSIWGLFRVNKARYLNVLYMEQTQSLAVSDSIRDLSLWRGFYDLAKKPSEEDIADEEILENELKTESTLPKTKSCDNLLSTAATSPPTLIRRSSDPNLCNSLPDINVPISSTPEIANFSAISTTAPVDMPDSVRHINGNCIEGSYSPCTATGHQFSFGSFEEFSKSEIPDVSPGCAYFQASDLPINDLSLEPEIELDQVDAMKDSVSTLQSRSRDSDQKKCLCCETKTVEVGLDVAKLVDSSHRPRGDSYDRDVVRLSNSSTPGHSRSSSSGVPSTPSEDRYEAGAERDFGLESVDGLSTPVESDATKRINELIISYQNQVDSLKKTLQVTKDLNQQLLQTHIHQIEDQCCEQDQLSLPDSLGSLESHADQESGISECTWDLPEREEAQQTLWVPDHAANRCQGCHTQFWMGRRRHHCRNCGQVFCSTCSDKTAAVTKENLFAPVRVCTQCFHLICAQEGC